MGKAGTLAAVLLSAATALVLVATTSAAAEVESELQRSFNLGARPLDVAVSLDGKSIFVLTEEGNVLIFGSDGSQTGRIAVGPQAERIAADPDGERLYVTNRLGKRVDVITVDVIRPIALEGAPFKGRSKAPVVVAVFSDFQ
jgi:DNA-binding beta-propeller fold protein YncE